MEQITQEKLQGLRHFNLDDDLHGLDRRLAELNDLIAGKVSVDAYVTEHHKHDGYDPISSRVTSVLFRIQNLRKVAVALAEATQGYAGMHDDHAKYLEDLKSGF